MTPLNIAERETRAAENAACARAIRTNDPGDWAAADAASERRRAVMWIECYDGPAPPGLDTPIVRCCTA